MSPKPDPRIRLQRHRGRVRLRCDETLIALTDSAIRLDEYGYPTRFYIPRNDIAYRLLDASKTGTHCPYKGDADYYHLNTDTLTLTDAAWCYPQPYTTVDLIVGHLAFDHPRLTLHVENH